MGLANIKYGNTVGVMGISLDVYETNATFNGGVVYPTIIDELQSQGFINAKAYCLWLDDLDSNTGSFLFGGVDRSKYFGELIALPIQPDVYSGNITSFTVSLAGIGFIEISTNETIYSGPALPRPPRQRHNVDSPPRRHHERHLKPRGEPPEPRTPHPASSISAPMRLALRSKRAGEGGARWKERNVLRRAYRDVRNPRTKPLITKPRTFEERL